MKSLFISTYNEVITIALLENGNLLACSEQTSQKSHSTALLPLIETTLKACNFAITEINEIIVINGPGSFTGVRLGVTVAKTLAYTLKVPIKTITSIEALGVSNPNHDKLVMIPDAKGSYFGVFNKDKLVVKIQYLSAELFVSRLEAEYKDLIQVKDYHLDIERIYEYVKNNQGLNPHLVNPVYIKTIEVENGK